MGAHYKFVVYSLVYLVNTLIVIAPYSSTLPKFHNFLLKCLLLPSLLSPIPYGSLIPHVGAHYKFVAYSLVYLVNTLIVIAPYCKILCYMYHTLYLSSVAASCSYASTDFRVYSRASHSIGNCEGSMYWNVFNFYKLLYKLL